MFPHLSSLNTSSSIHLPSSIYKKARSDDLTCKCMKNSPFNFNPDRPLLKLPFNFGNPDQISDSPVKFDFHPPPRSISSVPFSLRFVQLRKKRSNFPQLPKTPPPNLCPLCASVFSLASVVSEIQKLFLPNSSLSLDVSSSRHTGYSIMWLFQKVFVSSPALTIGILSLMGEFANVTLKSEIGWVLADLEWREIMVQMKEKEEKEKEEEKKFESWSEIGIKMEESVVESNIISMSNRRKITYERLIVCNDATSLILSNYAQFLYLIQKDYDRAEEYFERAVQAEPADAHAINHYASFLWKQKGDLEKAEEMYLKAIDIEPNSNFHLCAYSLFLWINGSRDFCVVGQHCD